MWNTPHIQQVCFNFPLHFFNIPAPSLYYASILNFKTGYQICGLENCLTYRAWVWDFSLKLVSRRPIIPRYLEWKSPNSPCVLISSGVSGSMQLHGLYSTGSSVHVEFPSQSTGVGYYFASRGSSQPMDWILPVSLASPAFQPSRFFTTGLCGNFSNSPYSKNSWTSGKDAPKLKSSLDRVWGITCAHVRQRRFVLELCSRF